VSLYYADTSAVIRLLAEESHIVSYDHCLLKAAADAGLGTASPRD
jgi:hypothetical protein